MPGLSGNYLRATQIAKGLIDNSCDVTLITSASRPRFFPKRYRLDELHVIESPGLLKNRFRHGGVDPYDFIWRCYLLFTLNADIFHGFNPKINSMIPTLLVGKIKNTPVFYDWADLWGEGGIRDLKKYFFLSNISSKIETFLERWLPFQVAATSCISKAMQNYCKKNHVSSVYLPVGLAPDVTVMNKKKARTELNLDKNKTIIGFTFTDSPDSKYLVSIVKQLYKLDPTILCILMGPKLENLNSTPSVVHNSFVERKKMSIYLAACDFCFLPFKNKKINKFRYPNKIGDYLAANKPFISNKTGDIPNLINTYGVGWIAEENADNFAKCIIKIKKNKALLTEAISNIKKCKKEFTWKKLTQDLKLAYNSSLVSKNPS